MSTMNNNNKTNYYLQLCTKSLADSISHEEHLELKAWLDQSVDNQNYFNECIKIWLKSDVVIPADIPDVQNEWKKLSRSLAIDPEEKQTNPVLSLIHRFFEPSFTRIRWATGFAVVILAVSALLYFNTPDHQTMTVTTQSTEKEYILLPDQSKVWLNSKSQLVYPKRFAENREIQLTGEAFFMIVPNSKPFVVRTENAQTRVLGTAFNVWARNHETRVVVKRGEVQLSRFSADTVNIHLTRNQTSRVLKNEPANHPQPIDADHYIGWMEGRLVFIETPLSEILNELERFYGIRINLIDSSLSQKTVTATFENKKLDTVLKSLSLSLDSDFARYENHIEFGNQIKRSS